MGLRGLAEGEELLSSVPCTGNASIENQQQKMQTLQGEKAH